MESNQLDLFATEPGPDVATIVSEPAIAEPAAPAAPGPVHTYHGGAFQIMGSIEDGMARADAASVIAVDSNVGQEVMTLAGHDSLFKNIVDHDEPVSPGTVRDAFERLVRDQGSVLAELAKLTIAVLLKRVATFFVREKKKDYLVKEAFSTMLNAYAYLMADGDVISITDVTRGGRILSLRAKLLNLSEDHLARYRKRVLDRRAEIISELQARKKAVTQPETAEDFRQFIKVNGREKLSAAQLAHYDELVAGEMRVREQAEAAKVQSASPAVAISAGGMELVETRHTRDDYPLFVVRIIERVDTEQFAVLRSKAKTLGGWYSTFAGRGAVRGFQFKSRDSAVQFMGNDAGEIEPKQSDVDPAEPPHAEASTLEHPENLVTQPGKAAARAGAKLLQMAERLKASAESDLSKPRNTNTARRARMASSAEADARKALALAGTMANLAAAISEGKAHHLERLTDKVQVEVLLAAISAAKGREISAGPSSNRDWEARKNEPATIETVAYVEFPEFVAWPDSMSRLEKDLGSVPGLSRAIAKIVKLTPNGPREDIKVPGELVEPVFEKLQKTDQRIPHYWVSTFERRTRLARMGITCAEQLRAACRELLLYREGVPKADRATELERLLVGSKVGVDFFPTPSALAKRMVSIAIARLVEGDRVLEPSAGNGNIACEFRAAGYEPDVVEVSSSLREILEAKGFNLVGSDFLDVSGSYKAIVMNPPFGNGADIDHVQHAWSLLEAGGCIVAIVGEGAFIRTDRKAEAFRDWLEELGAEVEKLPEGTFNDKSLMVTTGANARLVTITRD